jgi:DNA-binding NarL/FixJ family response regulator
MFENQKISIVANGRIAVFCPNHPGANNRGYVLRSRLVVEEKIKRLLLKNEQIHHINGKKTDDRFENLEITSCSGHIKIHWNKGDLKTKRNLDYEKIKKLRLKGLGYKKISKELKYCVSSVKSAVRKIERIVL